MPRPSSSPAGQPRTGPASDVRILCERIVVGQRDEIALMQSWLRDRDQKVPEATATHMKMSMNGMEHDMLMPGMLSEEQLAQLDKARGPEFDRLFLTFMIKHHEGALTMVEQLLASYGAAQDDVIFKFSSDIVADQSTEIDRMQKMLEGSPSGGRKPAMIARSAPCVPAHVWNGIQLMTFESLVRRLGTRRIALPLFALSLGSGCCTRPGAPHLRRERPGPSPRHRLRRPRRRQTPAAPAMPVLPTAPPSPDPRVGLAAGRMDAAEAVWNMRVVSKTPPSEQFLGSTNSDLAFTGKYAIQGNYNGFQVWDISNPAKPTLATGVSLPRVAERRLGLQEPALRVRRGPDGPPRLRHAGRARAGQQGAAARHPDLRRHGHGQPEVRGQRADLPRFAHAHRGDRPERQGERVHLCVRLGGRSVSRESCPGAWTDPWTTRIPRGSASRSSACRSRRRSRRPS